MSGINSKGLAVLSNGVVSMRELELCAERPSKSRDPDASKLFDTSLTFSKAFQFFSLVRFGKNHPVEKARDEDARRLLLRCAAPFAMNEVHVQEFFDSPSEQISAFGIGDNWTRKEPPAVHEICIVRCDNELSQREGVYST
jgi:hypothetical protein